MDRLDELTVLVTIIDTGSLAAAAKRLNRSAPAITRVLASLEVRTGDRLLARNSRRMEPTPRGLALAEDARQLLALYGAATDAIPRDRRMKRLRLTAPVQFGRRHVVPILARLGDEDPDLHCEVMLQDRPLDLLDERIDVAVRIGASHDQDLPRIAVGALRWVVVATPGYIEVRGRPATPRDLVTHDVLLGLRGGYASEWRLSEAGRRLLPRLRSRFAVDDVETRLRLVIDGRGLGQFISYQVFDEMADGRLARVLEDFEPPPLAVTVLHRRSTMADPALRWVVDRLTAELSRNPVLNGPKTTDDTIGSRWLMLR